MPAAKDRAPGEVLRRRRITLVIVGLVALGIACFFILRPSEPAYRGKSLTQWVEQLVKNYPRRDSEALEALRAMGQPAVRFLTRRVDHSPSRWRLRLAEMTENIPVVNRMCSVNTFDRTLATKVLADIGPTSKSAIPALEQAAKDEDRMLSLSARAALIRIRGESIEPHIATFRQFGTSNSAQIAFLLAELGPYAMPTLPALLEGMQSTNHRVRYTAVFALASIGYESPECVPLLQGLLSDSSHLIRSQALQGLANMGPLAKTALNNVLRSLQDTNELVRVGALLYFGHVLSDKEFSSIQDEVVRATRDTNSMVSDTARYVLSGRPHGNSGSATNR